MSEKEPSINPEQPKKDIYLPLEIMRTGKAMCIASEPNSKMTISIHTDEGGEVKKEITINTTGEKDKQLSKAGAFVQGVGFGLFFTDLFRKIITSGSSSKNLPPTP